MKLHLAGVLHLGKFEFNFKTLEFKLKVDHEAIVAHVKPKKVGFVIVHNVHAVHLAVSLLFLHVGLTYHKTCTCHPAV